MTRRFTAFKAALVGAPYGLDGRVKIHSLSGEAGHLLRLEKAILRRDGAEREYAVEAAFERPLSLKLAGIDSPEAAKTLKGAEIILPRAAAAPLCENEFYIEDLKGLEVQAVSAGTSADIVEKSDSVGKINDILEGGGGFLAEIALKTGGTRLVPFRNEFFGTVDLEHGRIELLVRWILE